MSSRITWHFIYHSEQNHHKCPKHLDLAYNMLTDTSLENLEYLVLERAGLSAMDLSWNMLSAKAVKKLGTSRILLKHFTRRFSIHALDVSISFLKSDLATHQRSKPRSLRREGGNFKKSLEPIALHLEDNQQRFSLMCVRICMHSHSACLLSCIHMFMLDTRMCSGMHTVQTAFHAGRPSQKGSYHGWTTSPCVWH